jgi:hypothetical protein
MSAPVSLSVQVWNRSALDASAPAKTQMLWVDLDGSVAAQAALAICCHSCRGCALHFLFARFGSSRARCFISSVMAFHGAELDKQRRNQFRLTYTFVQTNPSSSFFACNKAADHTLALQIRPRSVQFERFIAKNEISVERRKPGLAGLDMFRKASYLILINGTCLSHQIETISA